MLVNRESVVYNSGHRQIFLWGNAFEARHPHRSRVFALTALEGEMQPIHQPTKAEERALLRELAEQRQRQTPEHVDPAWMTAYWLRKGVMT